MSTIHPYSDMPDILSTKPPLLMIDRLDVDADAGRAVGIKAVSMDEAFFQGHFPGGPIMPGVLQLAAMCQTSEAIMRLQDDGMVFRLERLERVKFRRPVVPGDLLRIEAVLKAREGAIWTFEVSTSVEGKTACSGIVTGKAVDLAAWKERPQSCDVVLPSEWADTVADAVRILDLIPHRFPFQLVDRVAVLDLSGHIVAIKNVTGGEPWLRGVALAAFPGYLQVEAAAQAACAVALQLPENEGKLGYFMSIDEAVFPAPVHPGDQLVMDMNVQQRGRFGMAEGRLLVAGEIVATARMKFAIVDRT